MEIKDIKTLTPKHGRLKPSDNSPYIPEQHRKYDLLPYIREIGGEVFVYSDDISREIEDFLPDGETLIPYGYASYKEFDDNIDRLSLAYGTENGGLNKLGTLLAEYKNLIHMWNIKDDWSVMKYVGESTPGCFGLTKNRYYYWPCSWDCVEYRGVVDDEEFTNYMYSSDSSLWEIAEDPLGMAAAVLSGKNDSGVSSDEMGQINEQIKEWCDRKNRAAQE